MMRFYMYLFVVPEHNNSDKCIISQFQCFFFFRRKCYHVHCLTEDIFSTFRTFFTVKNSPDKHIKQINIKEK